MPDIVGPLSEGVGVTAVAAAAARAIECTRADSLVCDEYASMLVAAAHVPVEFPAAWPASLDDVPPGQWPLLLGSAYIGLRTRFIDDFLVSDHTLGQTVSLGAGLDTRAYRLGWSANARLFEVDGAGVLDFKHRVLAAGGLTPRCQLISVQTDLSQDWGGPLRAAGFDSSPPTTWLVEGLLPYLSAHAQVRTLNLLTDLSSSGSRCVLERAVALPQTPDMETKLTGFSAKTGLPMSDLLARATPPDPAKLLESRGWTVEVATVAAIAAQYGRALQLPRTSANSPGQSLTDSLSSDKPESTGGFVVAYLP